MKETRVRIKPHESGQFYLELGHRESPAIGLFRWLFGATNHESGWRWKSHGSYDKRFGERRPYLFSRGRAEEVKSEIEKYSGRDTTLYSKWGTPIYIDARGRMSKDANEIVSNPATQRMLTSLIEERGASQ